MSGVVPEILYEYRNFSMWFQYIHKTVSYLNCSSQPWKGKTERRLGWSKLSVERKQALPSHLCYKTMNNQAGSEDWRREDPCWQGGNHLTQQDNCLQDSLLVSLKLCCKYWEWLSWTKISKDMSPESCYSLFLFVFNLKLSKVAFFPLCCSFFFSMN